MNRMCVCTYSYSLLQMFTCTTSQTSCTAETNSSSVRFTYCVVVTAHTHRGNVSSASRCQSGRTEGETAVLPSPGALSRVSFFSLTLRFLCFVSVTLPPVILDRIQPVTGKPRCLTVSWSGTRALFPVSRLEVQRGFLKSQLQFRAQSQVGQSLTRPNANPRTRISAADEEPLSESSPLPVSLPRAARHSGEKCERDKPQSPGLLLQARHFIHRQASSPLPGPEEPV